MERLVLTLKIVAFCILAAIIISIYLTAIAVGEAQQRAVNEIIP